MAWVACALCSLCQSSTPHGSMTATPVAAVHTTAGGRDPPSAPNKPLNRSSLRPCVASDSPSFLQAVLKTIATLSLVVAAGSCCAAAEGASAGGGAAAAAGGGVADFYPRNSNVPSTAAAGSGRGGAGAGAGNYVRSCSAPSTAAAAFALAFRSDFGGQRRCPPPPRVPEAAQGTSKRSTTGVLQRYPQAFHSESRRSLDTTTATTTTSKLVRCAGLRESEGDGGGGAVRDRHGELVRRWGPPAVIRFEGVAKNYEKRRWFAAPVEVVALENTTLTLRGPGPFGLVGDSGAGKSTFLRLVCGNILPSLGRVSIEAPGAPKTVKVSAAQAPKNNEAEKSALAEGEAPPPDQGSPIPDRDTPATKRGDRGRNQPRAGKSPRCGVSYLGRYWSETVILPPSQKVSLVLADAFFCAQQNPGKKPPRPQDPSRSQETSQARQSRSRGLDGELDGGLDGVDDGLDEGLTESLLCVAGLGDVRDARCGDLRRGQLLVLALCVGVARAVVTAGQAAGSRSGGGGASAATDQLVGPVLCLDEFLEMEDPRVRRGVEEACAGLCAAGVTIVFATHIMDHVDGMMAISSTIRSPARNSAPNTVNSFSNSGGGMVSGGRNAPISVNSFDSGGKAAFRGGSGGVVSFSRGRAGELSPVEESTYVKWKKGESERRLARKII